MTDFGVATNLVLVTDFVVASDFVLSTHSGVEIDIALATNFGDVMDLFSQIWCCEYFLQPILGHKGFCS